MQTYVRCNDLTHGSFNDIMHVTCRRLMGRYCRLCKTMHTVCTEKSPNPSRCVRFIRPDVVTSSHPTSAEFQCQPRRTKLKRVNHEAHTQTHPFEKGFHTHTHTQRHRPTHTTHRHMHAHQTHMRTYTDTDTDRKRERERERQESYSPAHNPSERKRERGGGVPLCP